MFTRRIWAPCAALLAILLVSAITRAQALADKVPADTTIYLGWQGVESPGPGYDGSHLQAVIHASNIAEVFDEFIPLALDRIAQTSPQAAEGVQIFRALAGPAWRHPSAIAFVGVDLQNPNGPTPKFVLLCQAGKDSVKLKADLQALLDKAGQLPFPVLISDLDGLVAVTAGYDKAESAIPSGADSKSLANNPAFVAALTQVGKDPFAAAYVNVEKLTALIDMGFGLADNDTQAKWQKARDMLGLKGIKAAIATAGFDGKDWATQGFIAAPAPRAGLLGSLIDSDPLSEDLIHAVPKNATIAAGFRFDAAGLVSVLKQAVGAFNPDAAHQIDQGIEQINGALKLDLEKDFLGALGSEWAYYTNPDVAGSGVVSATIVNRLRDPEKAQQSFEKIEELINAVLAQQLQNEHPPIHVAFRHTQLADATVHYLAFPLIEPTWAIRDGNLYLGLYPEVVAAAVNHVAQKADGLSENKDAMGIYERFGQHPPASFQYLDLPRLAPNTYSSWLVLSHAAGAGDLFGVPAPQGILPPLKDLLDNLSPAGSISWAEQDGMHFHGISPFPGSTLFATDPLTVNAFQLPLAVSIMLPALNKAREQAQSIKSAANLKNIALGALTYANNHNGKFPADLATMAREEEMAPMIFINPRGNTPPPPGASPVEVSQWITEHSDYVWAAGGLDNSRVTADDAIAWEKQAFPQGRNFLFGDGHVEFVTGSRVNELISKAKPAN